MLSRRWRHTQVVFLHHRESRQLLSMPLSRFMTYSLILLLYAHTNSSHLFSFTFYFFISLPSQTAVRCCYNGNTGTLSSSANVFECSQYASLSWRLHKSRWRDALFSSTASCLKAYTTSPTSSKGILSYIVVSSQCASSIITRSFVRVDDQWPAGRKMHKTSR